MATARESFIQRAPAVMGTLMKAVPPLDVEGTSAIMGNLWQESRLQVVNEKNPIVAGSAGGWGWAQWTGSRRRAFFKYCADHKLDPHGDTAQISFLIHELLTTHKSAVTAVMRPGTLEEKTKAFELTFEKAHKDHKAYATRYAGARMALEAYTRNPVGTPQPAPADQRQWAEDRLAVFEIRAIQQRLKALGFGHMLGTSGKAQDGVDGDWGAKTAATVFAFQKKAGIVADGHYGPQTQAALARGLEPERPAPSPAPGDDVGRAIEEGITRMFGSLISLVGGKTLVSLAVALVAPYAARYGIGEESLNKLVADIALLGAAFGSADATKKAVARAAE